VAISSTQHRHTDTQTVMTHTSTLSLSHTHTHTHTHRYLRVIGLHDRQPVNGAGLFLQTRSSQGREHLWCSRPKMD